MMHERTEMYLKAIAGLEDEEGSATTSSLARDLDVSLPSVTRMLQRLAAKGLLEHEPRGPIRLTEEGQRLASALIRRHRLWESFLVQFLGLPWENVHDEACRLEHATSPELEEHLSRFLGDLETCPHGHAIPGRNGQRRAEPAVPLTELQRAGPARVVRIQREAAGFLRRLARLDIGPGRVLDTQGAPSRDRPVRVSVEGRSHQVAPELAREVMVRPVEGRELVEAPVSLSELRNDEEGTVEKLSGGKVFVARCLALGLTQGTPIRVVRNTGRGPLIVSVRDTRVALGRGESERVRVRRRTRAS